MTIAPVLMVAGVLVGGEPVSVLPSSSATVTPDVTAVTLGPSSSKEYLLAKVDGRRLICRRRASVIVAVSVTRLATLFSADCLRLVRRPRPTP